MLLSDGVTISFEIRTTKPSVSPHVTTEKKIGSWESFSFQVTAHVCRTYRLWQKASGLSFPPCSCARTPAMVLQVSFANKWNTLQCAFLFRLYFSHDFLPSLIRNLVIFPNLFNMLDYWNSKAARKSVVVAGH